MLRTSLHIVAGILLMLSSAQIALADSNVTLSAETEKTSIEYGSTPSLKLYVTTSETSISGISFSALYENLSHVKFNPAGSAFSTAAIVDGGQVGAGIATIVAASSNNDGLSGKLYIGELIVHGGLQTGDASVKFIELEAYDNSESLQTLAMNANDIAFSVKSEGTDDAETLQSDQTNQSFTDENGILVADDDGNAKILTTSEADEVLSAQFPTEQFDEAIDASVSPTNNRFPLLLVVLIVLAIGAVLSGTYFTYLKPNRQQRKGTTPSSDSIVPKVTEPNTAQNHNPTTEQDDPIVIKPNNDN